ncbi:MAG: 1,4-dihydroxy-2-naphthoate octaprenyltransferase [Flavobacteriaceae bacterium]|nr:1,4-dihydroxy-2-naphthoate octaprenyltransferase [Flavobacteriaceae bacterium]MDG1912100.1 1,4-dihydroxy-2-naphthoate octaprenyltransferase [Flavobacteriaceae bacterium]
MQQIKVWLSAARLRTLPLSISGILVGNALCLNQPNFSWTLFVLMLLTAISFQIISNFANDYGDGVKGTDNENRIGPKRVLQQGLLSKKVLKNGIIVMSAIALVLACTLIFLAFGSQSWIYIVVFFALSIFSVWAAISYTVGDKAYGYRGMGDLFVLLFFGGVSVLGSYFIQLKTLSLPVFLLALAIGLFSVGVLNLNNMRDRENDAAVGKKTLVVILGSKGAKRYHLILMGIAILLIGRVFLLESYALFWIPFIALIPLSLHLRIVIKNSDPKQLDPELKKVALSTFLLSILIFITLFIG